MKLIYSLLIIIGSLINGMFTMPVSHDQASFYILDKPSGSVFIPPPPLYAIVPPPPGPILNEIIQESTFFPDIGSVIFEPLEINIQ